MWQSKCLKPSKKALKYMKQKLIELKGELRLTVLLSSFAWNILMFSSLSSWGYESPLPLTSTVVLTWNFSFLICALGEIKLATLHKNWRWLSHVDLFVTPMDTARLLCPWNSLGNTGVGYSSLLQGIFLTEGSNLGLLLCRQIVYYLSHQGSPRIEVTSFQRPCK